MLGPPLLLALVAPGRSLVLSVAFCGALALLAARAGDALWRRLPASRDLLFADLMLWGWLRRVRTERQLAQAQSLLSRAGPADRPAALERVVAMMESRDAYTHQHSLRVSRYSEGIARRLGLGEATVERIRTAAALHDVGKLFTPREILNKPGRLTEDEFAAIKRHPGDGADLVKGLVGSDIEAMIRYHHERLGGNGYPSGLAGADIPLGARIIAVADTFDAMTSTRAYRKARAHQKALTVLKEEAGTALDAGVVTAFLAFYSGRRGVLTWGVASGFGPAVGSMRELFGGGVARLAPLLSTSAMVAAPMMTGTLPSLAMAHEPTPRHASAPRRVAAVPEERPALTRVSFTPATAAAPLADHINVARDVPAPVPRPVRHPRPRPKPSHAAPVSSPPAPTAAPALPVLADEMPSAPAEPVAAATPAASATAPPPADPTPTVVVKITPTPTQPATPTPTPVPTATPAHTATPTPVVTTTPPPVAPTPSVIPTPVVTPVPTTAPTAQPTPTPVPTIVISLPFPLPIPIPTVTIPLPFPFP